MSLIELMVVITVAAVVCTGVTVGLLEDGLLGGIAGGVWAAVGIWLFGTAVSLAFQAWYRLFPLRPRCATGRCGSDDYVSGGHADGSLDWRCACGDAYRQHWPQPGAPARFVRVEADGVERPFRVLRWMRWQPDGADRARSRTTGPSPTCPS